ncbi:MAG: hypothetical protein ACSHYB_03785 [Roseibacillus sp.]
MSEKTSDKRTYSVDEMMDRLRDGDREKREEGELVTREDGTQVMRVKKRKRRSKQKKEEEAKRRKQASLFRTLALIAIPLALGLGALYLLAKYNSPSFSQDLEATIWEETGARAKMSQLSPKGTVVTANSVQLNWPDGSHLDQFKASGVSGDLSLLSFATGKFRGNELNSKKGFLLTSGRGGRKVAEPKGAVKDLPGFQRYTSDFFSFFFGATNSPFRLVGSKVKLVSTDYSHLLSLTGGDMFAGSWGEIPLKRGTLEFLNDSIRVVSLRFEEEERSLVVSGDLGLKDSIHSLSVEVVEGTIGNVAGFGIGNLFHSDVSEATGTLVFRPWVLSGHEVTIAASPEYLTISNFNFLDVLEGLYGNAQFQAFEFEVENDFEVIRGASGAEIRGLELNELGVLAVKGTVKVVGEQLSGTLRVGLPDHKRLTIRSDQREEFFSKGQLEDGYFWYDVELGGTVEEPTDNFLQILQGGVQESAEDLFDQLTQ